MIILTAAKERLSSSKIPDSAGDEYPVYKHGSNVNTVQWKVRWSLFLNRRRPVSEFIKLINFLFTKNTLHCLRVRLHLLYVKFFSLFNCIKKMQNVNKIYFYIENSAMLIRFS